MLVGEGFGLDNTAEQTRLGCGLPAVPDLRGLGGLHHGRSHASTGTDPIDYQNTQAAWALPAFRNNVKRAAIIVPNGVPASIDAGDKIKSSYPSAGFEILDCDQLYSIAGESDRKPFIQRLKDCGAEAVYFNGAETNFENVLDAAKQLDYTGIWFVEPVFYWATFAAWNTSGNTNDVYVRNSIIPLDDPSRAPPPPSTSISSPRTAATSASSAPNLRRRSCYGPPQQTSAVPT